MEMGASSGESRTERGSKQNRMGYGQEVMRPEIAVPGAQKAGSGAGAMCRPGLQCGDCTSSKPRLTRVRVSWHPMRVISG